MKEHPHNAHHPPVSRTGAGCPAMNPAAVDVNDDPEARKLLRRAFESTYRWPAGFGGFRADLICTQPGRSTKGTVEIRSPREVTVTCDDPSLQEWADGQISMMAVHRGPRSFEESDGRHVLTLGEDDGHPMGRALKIHGDGMNSCYRILDNRIAQITRGMERMKFTINVEDSLITPDGRHLTTRYVVYYFNPADGRLMNVDSFCDHHAVVKGIYLPGVRRVTSFQDGQLITRELRFEHHVLL